MINYCKNSITITKSSLLNVKCIYRISIELSILRNLNLFISVLILVSKAEIETLFMTKLEERKLITELSSSKSLYENFICAIITISI